jgi:chaperonin GroEL
MARPGVILPPRSRAAIQRGVDQMADLLKVTLGPCARTVAIEPTVSRGQPPEILDDGATIARRVIELPNRLENVGAMLLRQIAFRTREEVGDGATSAAVIAQAILAEANRYIAAGGNVMRMRAGVELGVPVIMAELDRLTKKIEEPDEMTALISGVTNDPQLGEMFGEIYDIIGGDAVVVVQDAQATRTFHEYVEGVQWDKGFVSPYMATDADRNECVLEDVPILITNRGIKTAKELLPIFEKVRAAGFTSLFIISNDITADAIAMLVVNKQQGVLTTLAVNSPGYGDRRMEILRDICVLTGGRLINEDEGATVESATLEDLGRARRVWADRANFNIVGGYGDAAAVRERIAVIRKEIPTITDEYERGKARERLGKLSGGIAVVSVGAPTPAAQKEKRNRVEAAVSAMRTAGEGGVVAGGGIALLACARAVLAIEAEGDVAMGLKVLAHALGAPAHWIIANSGQRPTPIIAELARRPEGWGYDVLKGEYVDMLEAGIADPTLVVKKAVEIALSGAQMAMTTDTLVLHSKPDWTPAP